MTLEYNGYTFNEGDEISCKIQGCTIDKGVVHDIAQANEVIRFYVAHNNTSAQGCGPGRKGYTYSWNCHIGISNRTLDYHSNPTDMKPFKLHPENYSLTF